VGTPRIAHLIAHWFYKMMCIVLRCSLSMSCLSARDQMRDDWGCCCCCCCCCCCSQRLLFSHTRVQDLQMGSTHLTCRVHARCRRAAQAYAALCPCAKQAHLECCCYCPWHLLLQQGRCLGCCCCGLRCRPAGRHKSSKITTVTYKRSALPGPMQPMARQPCFQHTVCCKQPLRASAAKGTTFSRKAVTGLVGSTL
jgi:hypothetical protein